MGKNKVGYIAYNQVVISGLKEDIEKASDECIKKRS